MFLEKERTFVHRNNGITAGGIDYLRQSAQQQRYRDNYIRSLNTPPGPPTQQGIYASPAYTGQPYPSIDWQEISQNQPPPNGWPRPPRFNDPGDVPGPPVQFGPPITNDNIRAGYSFVNNGVEEKSLYYYHPDYLGSSSYITDKEGKIIQHTEYMAFGEVLFDEHLVSPKQPYLFNGKELDYETGLYYYGARYYDPKTSIFLNVDPLVEKTMSPYAYTYNNPINLIDPTGMEPTPGEAARIAAHVYGDKKDNILIGGWRVSKKDFGIELNTNEGLKSQIYERVVNGKVTEYVYATAGTEDMVDMIEDGKQLLGLSKQYEQSVDNAQKLSQKLQNIELNFVGHSLGGGEAALNSMATQGDGKGRKAFTFNAAGVGDITKIVNMGWKSALKPESNINAYILTTDPLNLLQNSNGGIGLVLPDVNGKRHYLSPKDSSSIYNGHSMDNVLKNFGVTNPSKYNKK